MYEDDEEEEEQEEVVEGEEEEDDDDVYEDDDEDEEQEEVVGGRAGPPDAAAVSSIVPAVGNHIQQRNNMNVNFEMNWLASTLRFTRNIPALELIGLVLRLCLCFRLCVHSLYLD